MVNFTKFGSHNWSGLTYFSFMRCMTKLEVIDLTCCYFVGSKELSAAFMFCPELVNINLSGNVQFKTKHVIKIMMNHPKLEIVNVMGTSLGE